MSSTFNTGDMSFFKQPTFDPVAMLLAKKRQEQERSEERNAFIAPPGTNVNEWPEEDLKELESFCAKYGIIGFNAGRMNPKAALRMLKGRMGIYEQPQPKRDILLG
jgi:hypothetical protein